MNIHILMGFCHAHLITNDYPFPCVWVFVMHISVRMTIFYQFISNAFLLNGNSEFLGVFSSNVLVSHGQYISKYLGSYPNGLFFKPK